MFYCKISGQEKSRLSRYPKREFVLRHTACLKQSALIFRRVAPASYPGALIWDHVWDTLGYIIRIHEVFGQAGDARRGCWEGCVLASRFSSAPFPPALSRFSRHYDTSCKLDVNSPYAHHCFSQRDAWVRGRCSTLLILGCKNDTKNGVKLKGIK